MAPTGHDTGFRPLSFPHEEGATPAATPFPSLCTAAGSTEAPAEQDRMRQLEAMLQEMQGRAEIIEKEAWEKAYAAGEKAGMELGRRRAEQLLTDIEALRDALEREVARLREQGADAIVEIAVMLAQRLIGHALAAHPAWLAELAGQAIERLAPEERLVLRAPPDATAALRTMLDEARLARIVPDTSLPPGQCRIEGEERTAILAPENALRDLGEALKRMARDG
ncbi:MAG: FliH/SctL family protein [Mariprofundaceae bacterium]